MDVPKHELTMTVLIECDTGAQRCGVQSPQEAADLARAIDGYIGILQELGAEDVVLLPAFGVETPLLDALQARGVQMVDAVCGEVMLVWRRVREYAREGYTTVIHGAPRHQETRATVSRAQHDDPFLRHAIETPAAWIVVRDLADAERLAEHVVGAADGAEFMARFQGCTSPGFRAES